MAAPSELVDRAASRIGFWAACSSAVLVVIYLLAELAYLLGWLGAHNSGKSLVVRMVPGLFLAIAFVILMVSVHYCAPQTRKVWSHIGVAFAIVYAVLVSLVYFVVLTVGAPNTAQGVEGQVAILAFEPGAFLYAVDVLGFGFLSLATLFAAPVFWGQGLRRWIFWVLFVNGLLAPAIPLEMVYPPIVGLISLWGLTFPAATVLLAIFFRRLGCTSSEKDGADGIQV